jgi:hypothetical protein
MNQAMLQIEHAPVIFAPVPRGRKRNLGGAVILSAIEDYRSPNEQAHRDAAPFLYPRNRRDRADFAWAVAMAETINEQWLRELLDQKRRVWDAERAAKGARWRRSTALRCTR